MSRSVKVNVKKTYIITFLLSYLFYNTEFNMPQWIQTILTIFCLCLFVLWVIREKVNIKMLILYVGILCIGLVSYYITNMSVFLLILLGIIMLGEEDIKSVSNIFIIMRFLSVCVVLISSILGLIPNLSVEVYKSGRHISKYAFGFNHPNQLGQALGILVLMFMVTTYYKKQSVYSILYILLIAILYVLSGARSATICCMLLLVYIFFTKNKKWKEKINRVIFKLRWVIMSFILLLGVGLALLMTKLTGTALKYLYIFNGLVGSRYSFSSAVINNYDISLFGNVFDFSYLETLYGNYAVDNGYIFVLYGFGIIALVVLIIFSMRAIKNLMRTGKEIYAILIYILLLWGCMENILFIPTINFGLFLLGVGKKKIKYK